MTRLTPSLLVLLACSAGCQQPQPPPCTCQHRTLRLATTTSVDNTGLLGVLLGPFEKRTGIKTHVLSVGTGQALKLAERGDVDLVLVHDRTAEEAFIAGGFGLRRTAVMHNDFVLIGPPTDPARVRGTPVSQALARIASQQAPFVSRGDESGTHRAELRLWQRAGIRPTGTWYQESGQGQRLTVNMANEKQAYALTDRATFLDAEPAIALQILVEGDPLLHNPYSAIAVSPARHPHVGHVEAMALIGWLTSAEGQKLIGDYRKKGRQLFHPDVVPLTSPKPSAAALRPAAPGTTPHAPSSAASQPRPTQRQPNGAAASQPRPKQRQPNGAAAATTGSRPPWEEHRHHDPRFHPPARDPGAPLQ